MRKGNFKYGVAFYMFTSLFLLGAVLATVNIVTIRTLNDFRTGLNQLAREDLSQIQLSSQLSQISATLVSYGALIIASENSAGQSAILLQANEQVSWLDSILTKLEKLDDNRDDVNAISELSSDLVQNLSIIIELLERKSAWLNKQNDSLSTLDNLFLDLQSSILEQTAEQTTAPEKVISLVRQYKALVAQLIDEPIEYRIGTYKAQLKVLDNELISLFDAACLSSNSCLANSIVQNIAGEKNVVLAREGVHKITRQILGKLNFNSILSSKILASSSRITQRLQKRIILQSDRLEKSAEEKVIYLYILLFVSFSGFALILVYTDRKIIQRLDMLKRNMLDLASKRSKLMPIYGNDEISEMASAFHQYFETSKKNVLELREANEATRKARERAEKADINKSRFLAAASHDLRQPLHAIGLLVEAAVNSPHEQTAQQQGALRNIQSSVTNMESLFEAILDYSQLETGHLSFEPSVFPLQSIFDRIEHDFQHLAQNKSLELAVVKTKVWVHSDQNILERCIRNLVFNAINYTEKGKVLLGLRRDGGNVRVDVIDTGIGISKDVQQKLFHEYYQEDSDGHDGYGLGLAIVKELVQVLGSQIHIVSEPSKGACFSFRLPRADADIVPIAVSKNLTKTTPVSHFLSGKHIVLVEDNAQIREATESLLYSWGAMVHTASTQAAAEQCFQELGAPPVAVISDYQFGEEINGVELLKSVLKGHEDTTAGIIISGNTDPGIIADVKSLGYSFLSKPVKPSKISALLRHITR